MTSFESIERLRYRAQAPPQVADGAALRHLRPSVDPATERRTDPELSRRARATDLTRDASATRQLTQAQRMQSIGRVTGGIAHNFNNLLAGIMGFCELMAAESEDQAGKGRYLEKIVAATDRGSHLVKQLLAISQQQILEPRPFDINRAVNDHEPRLRRMAGEHIQVVTDLDAEPGPVYADPKQIERMLSNLTANATEAMVEGGRLTLRTRRLDLEAPSISHLGIPKGRYMLLEVEDTGSGIDDAVYDQIFEPFFSTKEALNGTGLGLSVAFGIVKQTGGQIRVESSPGHGTCFRVYLPRTAPRDKIAPGPAADPVVAPATELARHRETILLAEDDPTIRLVLEAFLAKRGYRVLVACDGAEGLELAKGHDGRIDLLLTDIVMPRMNGLELAQIMVEQRAGTQVLFISGYTQEREALCELLDATQVEFLKKPFEHEILELKLREMLDLAAGRQPQGAAA